MPAPALLQLHKTLQGMKFKGSRGYGHPELMPFLLDHALDAQDHGFPCLSSPKSASRNCIDFPRVQAASTTGMHNCPLGVAKKQLFAMVGAWGTEQSWVGKDGIGCRLKPVSFHISTFHSGTLRNCKVELAFQIIMKVHWLKRIEHILFESFFLSN